MDKNPPTFTFSPEHQDECLVMVPGTYQFHILPKPPEHKWDHTITDRMIAISPPAVAAWLLRFKEMAENEEDLKEGDLCPVAGHFSDPNDHTMIHTMIVGTRTYLV